MIQPSRRVRSTIPMNPPMSGQYMARNTTRPRAEPPARWPRGTPTRPGAGVPAGTRTAAGSAGANRPDGWDGTSRTDPNPTPRTAGAGGRSSPHSSPFSSVCPPSSRPVLLKKLDLVPQHESRLLPPRARTISGNRRNFTFGEIPAKSGNFRRVRETSRNFRGFRKPPAATSAPALAARLEMPAPDSPCPRRGRAR
jgi:hypothetical protein